MKISTVLPYPLSWQQKNNRRVGEKKNGKDQRSRDSVSRSQVDSQNEACITVIGTNKQQLIFNQHGTGKPQKKNTSKLIVQSHIFTSVYNIIYHSASARLDETNFLNVMIIYTFRRFQLYS